MDIFKIETSKKFIIFEKHFFKVKTEIWNIKIFDLDFLLQLKNKIFKNLVKKILRSHKVAFLPRGSMVPGSLINEKNDAKFFFG